MTEKFTNISFPISGLLDQIATGQIALPELQRPFVWDRAQVRDLLDSLYRGYPAGYFLLWQAQPHASFTPIGTGAKQSSPNLLVVDGQQRLTSLYAVFRGEPVLSNKFVKSHIQIGFNPESARFEVANTAIAKDPEWLSDVSTLLSSPHMSFAFINDYLASLRKVRDVSDELANKIAQNLQRLAALNSYTFHAIQLSFDLPVEEVSEIFVRVNSKGTQLNQADFILTLMSVYWTEGRKELEAFCQAALTGGERSPKNPFIDPSPDQLLRVAIGLGHQRAALRYVYELLRGKDLKTQEISVETREANFKILAEAQKQVLNVTNWTEFLKSIQEAGYVNSRMIVSRNNLIFSYLVFLIGRCDHGVDVKVLRSAVARWFFMCVLTSRYATSPESQVDKDLRRFGEATSADEFLAVLHQQIETALPNDFWEHNLPDLLAWSGANIPSMYAYFASLNLLDAKPLFSNLTVLQLLGGGIAGKKTPLEKHHLFPKGYLASIGIDRTTQVNQVANFALLEWPDNIKIGAKAPAEYFPPSFAKHVATGEANKYSFWHALPQGWETMDYQKFLPARRKLIAQVIRAGFEKLTSGLNATPAAKAPLQHPSTVAELIEAGESLSVEFKSSLYVAQTEGVPEKVIIGSVTKTVAAMLNTEGGTLVIGVADNGDVLGLDADLALKKFDRDMFENALMTLLSNAVGPVAAHRCKARFETIGDKVVCLVDVEASSVPVYANTDKGTGLFFTRLGNTTRVLETPQAVAYIAERWGVAN